MKSNLKLCFLKGDLLVVLMVAVLAVSVAAAYAVPAQSTPGKTVQIYRDGRLTDELPLHTDAVLRIEREYTNVITVSGGKVSITESDCPGGDCMHSGRIDATGRSIVCLPNRVEIRVTGASDVDFVVG